MFQSSSREKVVSKASRKLGVRLPRAIRDLVLNTIITADSYIECETIAEVWRRFRPVASEIAHSQAKDTVDIDDELLQRVFVNALLSDQAIGSYPGARKRLQLLLAAGLAVGPRWRLSPLNFQIETGETARWWDGDQWTADAIVDGRVTVIEGLPENAIQRHQVRFESAGPPNPPEWLTRWRE